MLILAILFIYHNTDEVFSHTKTLDPLTARCSPRSNLLNDCNWCMCDDEGRYRCAARSCSAVDIFGHFKDAIADINVGMEGRGSWRSNLTACIPNTHFGQDDLLCICNENGEWPNPICRDMFRVLHPVVPISVAAVVENQECRYNELYLVGCNICLCSNKGYLDRNLCTEFDCRLNDPVKLGVHAVSISHKSNLAYDEIYAACKVNEVYHLGCRRCICLKNNRLMCNNCSETLENKGSKRSICDDRKANEIFNLQCNFCQCDKMKNMFCTTKKCLLSGSSKLNEGHNIERRQDADKKLCTVKEFGKNCKSCECADNGKGQYDLECSDDCDETPTIHNGCVEDSVYEKDCLLCFCYSSEGRGLEICVRDPICDAEEGLNSEQLNILRTKHGSCKPFHTYKRDCNVCECLADGKTLKCTSNRCASQDPRVKMVPMMLKDGDACQVGSMYQQMCNICVCQANNRSLCTTLSCESNHQ